MKVLFIYQYEFIEPLGIMYISTILEKNGHDCHFIDVALEKNFIQAVQKISPNIIAYSVTTGKHQFYQKINQILKRHSKFFSFFGGPHCTFFPEFIYEEGVDAVCRGEGELASLELLDSLERSKDITRIRNLWIKVNGKIYKNDVRVLIDNLDKLPFPDRKLFYKYEHYRKMQRRFILSSRGCPYECTYCFNHAYQQLYSNRGKLFRQRQVGNVIDELKVIKNSYKPKIIQIADDIFGLDSKWMFNFCDAYRKEINIPFFANLRVDLITKEKIKAIKDAGCITVAYGLESANERIRNNVLKRRISRQQITDAADLINRHKIKSTSLNLIGCPDETLDTAFETLALNIKCKPTYALASIFQPYPRTEACEYARKKGYFESNINSIDQSIHIRSVMKIKDIAKIERLHHLFPLGVTFPIFTPLIKILIKLPLNRFYLFLWKLHRVYHYVFKLKYVTLPELFFKRQRGIMNKINTI